MPEVTRACNLRRWYAKLMSIHAGSDRIVRQKPGSVIAFSTVQIVQSMDGAQQREHL